MPEDITPPEDFNSMRDFFNDSTDGFNSAYLEQAAITFSAEGISKDLKYFIEKKIYHNKESLANVSKMLENVVKCHNKTADGDKKDGFDLSRSGPLYKLLNHTLKEIKVSDTFLNMIIHMLIDKSMYLEKAAVENDELLDQEEYREDYSDQDDY